MSRRQYDADAARDNMVSEVLSGGGGGGGGSGGGARAPTTTSDALSKTVLTRGCDPEMARRSEAFLPQLVGGARFVSTTDDAAFFAALRERRFDAVFFAPGACRWSAARRPIPGGVDETRGWSLEQYRARVQELQGADVPIVESLEEREVVPRLRAALGLQ